MNKCRGISLTYWEGIRREIGTAKMSTFQKLKWLHK